MDAKLPPLAYTQGCYRIRAHGRLDATWSAQLGNMQLVIVEYRTEPIVVLTGMLADQTALLGVLNQLSLLGLAVLSVEYLGDSCD